MRAPLHVAPGLRARLTIWTALLLLVAGPAAPAQDFDPARVMMKLFRGEEQSNLGLGVFWCARFSPDGKSLATAHGEQASAGQVVIWDPATGKLRFRIDAKTGFRSLAYSADGKTLACGNYDGSVKLVDPATGKERLTIKAHKAGLNGVCYSADGKTLTTAGFDDKTAKLWDAETGKEKLTLTGGHRMLGVALSPDGKLLATASGTAPGNGVEGAGVAQLWDAATGKEKFVLQGHANVVEYVTFSPDSRTLVTTSWDASVRLWDTATGLERMALQGHPSGVMSASFSADGKTLATVGAYHESGTGEVRLWDVASGQERGQLTHPGPVWSADFSPDGRTLATACRDGAVHLWELSTQHQRFRFPGAIQGPQTTAVPGPATPSQPGAIEAAPLAPPKVRSAFDAQWNDLASADAVRAYRALVVLTVAGDQAVPVLSERLQSKAEERAAPVDPQKLARWITDLDADAPEARDQAMAELKKLGRAAEPALRQAFKTAPSAEVHLRVEVLLEKLAAVPPEGVRGHRAIEALEHIGTPAARKALADLAERAVMAPWKDDARTSLARLERRAAP